MSEIAIRRAVAADLEVLTGILLAMERHYEAGALPAAEIARARIEAALFGRAPIAFALLAEAGGEAVGVAVVNWLFPTKEFLPGLFLKDLYVRPAWRGRGVARALMAELAALAARNGHPRIDWTTDHGNAAATALYRDLGAAVEEKHFFRVRREGYEGFIARARGGEDET